MSSTWRTLLCQNGWTYPTTYGNWIKFNEDGSGELHCGVSPAAFICAELKWRTLGDTSAATNDKADTHHQASFDIEITLCSTIPDALKQDTQPGLNERNLTVVAFRPKTYRLEIATGGFPAERWLCFDKSSPDDAGEGDDFAGASYDLRITFDQSPYPPLEEWAEENAVVGRAIRSHRFWEFRDFYRDD